MLRDTWRLADRGPARRWQRRFPRLDGRYSALATRRWRGPARTCGNSRARG